jgi:hypothetical protein
MKKSEIATIISRHPEISYEEGWRQALQAGLAPVDFQSAWAESHGPNPKGDPDVRIREMVREMKRVVGKGRALWEWKAHFAEKGIAGAECELAYELSDAKEALGSLSTHWMRRMATLLVVLSVAFGLWLGGRAEGSSVAGFLWTLLSLVAYFVCFLALGAQFRGNALKIVEHELAAEPLDPSEWLAKWKADGFGFLGMSGCRLTRLSRIRYRGKATYFGEYVHREGEGAYTYSVSRFLVAQELGKKLPGVHCVHEWRTTTSVFNSPIPTGGKAFDSAFTTFSGNAPAALALLGKGASRIMAEKGSLGSIKSFEAVGDTSVFLFAPIALQTDIRFTGPIVRFNDYQRIKNAIIDYLDLAARINDTL